MITVKKKFYLAKWIKVFPFLSAILLAFTTSCENFSDSLDNVRDINMVFPPNSFNTTVEDGNDATLVISSPKFTSSLENIGYKIKNIKYYIDNIFVTEVSSAPFSLHSQVPPLLGGKHTLDAVITTVGENLEENVTNCQSFFYVTNLKERIIIDYDPVIRTEGKFHVSASVFALYEQSTMNIDSIRLVFNNQTMACVTEHPYSMEYPVGSLTPYQNYPISIKVWYSQKYSSYSIQYSHEVKSSILALGENETITYFALCNSDVAYYNGEVIQGRGKLYSGLNDNDDHRLNIYIDNNIVASSSEFPYDFIYKLTGLEKGPHTLKYVWETFDENGKIKNSNESKETFTIVR